MTSADVTPSGLWTAVGFVLLVSCLSARIGGSSGSAYTYGEYPRRLCLLTLCYGTASRRG